MSVKSLGAGKPTPDEVADLRLHLLDALRSGDVAARKDLFAALVAELVVNDRDDIRPTFRLYGLDEATETTQTKSPRRG